MEEEESPGDPGQVAGGVGGGLQQPPGARASCQLLETPHPEQQGGSWRPLTRPLSASAYLFPRRVPGGPMPLLTPTPACTLRT